MVDAGNPIYIDIKSSEVMINENGKSSSRYVLGYISGEFSKNLSFNNPTFDGLFVKIWFKRGADMEWESVLFRLNQRSKIFRQKIPGGLLVATVCIEMYGWVVPDPDDIETEEFELTAFKLSVKEMSVGKFGGEPLLREDSLPDSPVTS